MSHVSPLHPVVAKLRRIESELNRYLIGRSEEIHGCLLALAARQHVFLLGNPGTAKCVAGDTRVILPDTGEIVRMDALVSRVQAGEDVRVLGLDEAYKLHPVRVSAAANNGVQPVFTLRTRLGHEIKATANHPFLTLEGWKALEDLRDGEAIAAPRRIPTSSDIIDHRSDDLIAMLALLIGDGSLTIATPYFSAHADSPLRDIIEQHAKGLGLALGVVSHKGFAIIDPQATWQRPSRLTKVLRDMGLMGKKSEHKFVPEIVFTSTDRQIALFLNRLWGTDGTIGTRKTTNQVTVSYTSISRRLAYDVQHLLLRVGVVAKVRTQHPKIYDGTDKVVYTVDIMERTSLLAFLHSVGAAGKEAKVAEALAVLGRTSPNPNVDVLPLPVWPMIEEAMAGRTWASMDAELGRGRQSWHVGIRRPSRARLENIALLTKSPALSNLASSDVWWDEVVSVEPAGSELTYDIEVPEGHNFVANDLIVHNSLLALEVARRVRGAEFFRIDLHAFTMREELFGPISLSALRERDALERKTTGFLPAAHIAQLDEIWKCPPSTLNTLLSILNEREFRNDDELLRAPLVSALVTSNETPPADRTLDALYDRILLRYQVAPLRDTADRRRAAHLSLSTRAFESEARRVAAEIRENRENSVNVARQRRVAAARELSGDALETEAPDPALVAAAGLHLSRPERWLLDRHGEIFSDPDERERFREGHYSRADLPLEDDRIELLRRMVAWADEQDLQLPYETFLNLSDLETLNGLVLAMTMPDSVEDAFYRIIDALGGVSVRRETELRTLVAAEAVSAGHATVAADDLAIMTHALWDRPDMIAEARRAVEKESGNLAREIESLRATIAAWQGEAAAPRSVADSLNFRTQMDQELARFKRLAEAYPDNAELSASLEEAKDFRDQFNARLFLGGPTTAGSEANEGAIRLPGGRPGDTLRSRPEGDNRPGGVGGVRR